MKIKNYLRLTLFLILFSSCSTFKDASFQNNKAVGKAGLVRVPQFLNKKSNDKGTFMWSHYDATKRGSLIYIDKNGRIRVLAENPPDAAIQSITNITASANVSGKVDASLVYKTSKSIAELGKRTASVNMLRDALYRLNEMYYATRDEKENYIKFFYDKGYTKENVKSLFEDKSLSSIKNIDSLFIKVIDNAKEIAIKEAEADIEKSKSDISKYKNDKAKMEVLKVIIQKAKDSLSTEQINEYLNKLNK